MSRIDSTIRREIERAIRRSPGILAIQREMATLRKQLRILEGYRQRDTQSPPTAAQIRALRQKRLRLSRSAFAERLGVSASIVYLWETGRRSPQQRRTVAGLRMLMRRMPRRGRRS